MKIPVYQPSLTGNEKKYVDECLDTAWISSKGKYNDLFAHEKSKVHYDVLTSFEMFEHLVNPLETIQALSSLADTIVFSTALVPKGRPKTNEWWYFCLDHGQHVAFYTKESLRICAGKIGMNYYNLGNLHIMTKVKLPELKLHVLSNNRIRYLLSFVFPRRRSLLGDDYFSLTGKQL